MIVIITGPESSGKSTLVEELSTFYKVCPVHEYAREYLAMRGGLYEYMDLLVMAKQQQNVIQEATIKGGLVISDTDLLTIKIWSDLKYGKCEEWILAGLKVNKPDLYLLCKPDIPWTPDPLRENPNNRDELFEIYEKEISNLQVAHSVISGNNETRLQMAKQAIEELKNKN